MYIVNLTYLKPMPEIELQLEAHRGFLDHQYAAKVFLASGPKTPRDGGVILASGNISRAELDALLTQDPFFIHDIASYAITEFTPLKFHPALAEII
ncbi:MAG: YciI family protein [Pseudomonas sp.]